MTADPPTGGPEAPGAGPSNDVTVPHAEDLLEDLAALEGRADADADVRDVEHLLAEAHERGLIDARERALGATDAAQALVGSVVFAVPLLVEDGVFDIATHLFDSTVAGVPVFLLANTAFVVLLTYALLEWTGRTTTETTLLFGRIPLRLPVILVVSFAVAAVLMTVWGRVETWERPLRALARVNVLWTVGALGAALGDIVSQDDPSPTVRAHHDRADVGRERRRAVADLSDGALIEELADGFDDLATAVGTPDDRRRVRRLRESAVQAALDDAFGDTILKYTSRDVAEAFVGAVFFSVPFLVEDGVTDVAAFFLTVRLGPVPVYFLVNTAFVLVMITTLVYWAGPQDVVVTRPILGIVPRRLVGIAVVSALTAAMLATMWGRLDAWGDPAVALMRISVVWTLASFGAALGDILPGESSGADINDDLAALADMIEDGTDGEG